VVVSGVEIVVMADLFQPLVTVVTPSYNYGRFIGACLESVRAQRYPRIEHLVFDACSTDDTSAILRRFEGTNGLAVRVERDRGQADALNKGFALSRGDVLCWLNADDFWLDPGVVERAVGLLGAAPEVGLVTATGRFVDESGALGARIPLLPVADLRYHDTILQPATFWRRSVHRPLRDDLDFTFDWRFFLDLAAAGVLAISVDEEWAAYRMHAVNKTAADPARRRREVADLLEAEWGRWSVQHAWARAIAAGYAASETTGISAIKSCCSFANTTMGRLTRRRVFSS
jgi:glycosyltransferase involved in cell wall biosynthesis